MDTDKKILTMDRLSVGQRAVITSVRGKGALRRRLLDLGLTPYTPVMIRKMAPLGDPVEIFLRGYSLTLRKEEASAIEVDIFECSNCSNCYFGMKSRCPGTQIAGMMEEQYKCGQIACRYKDTCEYVNGKTGEEEYDPKR